MNTISCSAKSVDNHALLYASKIVDRILTNERTVGAVWTLTSVLRYCYSTPYKPMYMTRGMAVKWCLIDIPTEKYVSVKHASSSSSTEQALNNLYEYYFSRVGAQSTLSIEFIHQKK